MRSPTVTESQAQAASDSIRQMLASLRPHIASLLHRYQVPGQDQQDLLQDALVVFLEKKERIQNPPAWLLGCLRNQCFQYWRRRRRNLCEAVDSALLESLAPPSQPRQENSTLRRDLNRMIARLPRRCHAFLRLRYALDCDSREVAQRMAQQMGYREASIRPIGWRCLSALASAFVGRPLAPRGRTQ